ncbi:hypothetical protein TJA_17960 [Thermus sp. LT1-2-5]
MEVEVGEEGPGEDPRLREDLEAVADPDDEAPFPGEAAHRLHHWALGGEGPGPQVVPVAEPPREEDPVKAFEVPLRVPDELRPYARLREGKTGVFIAVGAGEANDGPPHSSFRASRV